MRKQLFTIAMLGLFLMLTVASVHAQSKTRIEATIPFDFMVGETKLKAGQYDVTPRNAVALLIRSKDNRNAAVRLTNSIQGAKPSMDTKLVFHRYGQTYFLSEVWIVGQNAGCQLVKSQQEQATEKQIAAGSSRDQQTGYARVEIPASRP
jgi:hypothetical protein